VLKSFKTFSGETTKNDKKTKKKLNWRLVEAHPLFVKLLSCREIKI
jgi:hypothetical protein